MQPLWKALKALWVYLSSGSKLTSNVNLCVANLENRTVVEHICIENIPPNKSFLPVSPLSRLVFLFQVSEFFELCTRSLAKRTHLQVHEMDFIRVVGTPAAHTAGESLPTGTTQYLLSGSITNTFGCFNLLLQ